MGEIIHLKDIIENENLNKEVSPIDIKKSILQEKPIEVKIIKEPEIPKEFKYLQHLAVLKERGYIFKYFYNEAKILKQSTKMKFEIDSEGQSFIPIKPDLIEVYKYFEGEGFEKIASLNGTRSRDDPDVDMAMNIWDIIERL